MAFGWHQERMSYKVLLAIGVRMLILEVGGWRTTADDVDVARVPFPGKD